MLPVYWSGVGAKDRLLPSHPTDRSVKGYQRVEKDQHPEKTADVQVEKFIRNKSKDAAVTSRSTAESGPEPNNNQKRHSKLNFQQPTQKELPNMETWRSPDVE